MVALYLTTSAYRYLKHISFDMEEFDDVLDVSSDDVIIPEVVDEDSENSLEISDSDSEDYSDVLHLTAYDGGMISNEHTDFIIAEYENIDTKQVDKETKLLAKKFVTKITKFILDFNDVQLSEEHRNYIRQVGLFQLDNLKDMLSLVEINKQMINNIVARVNAVQAEDYVIINSYNNLVNQHLKLLKEVTNFYKSIPATIKKMRADILSNQELENEEINNELLTENYGETQFNSSKQMLRTLLEKRKNSENSAS